MVSSASFILLLLWHLLVLLAVVSGQMDIPPPYLSDYDTNAENEEFVFENFVPPFRNERERRFMESLVVEAGRHVLFPELYIVDKDGSLIENKGLKYFELKGQPELEESYTNRQARNNKQPCPLKDCPLYKPICGSDGKVYNSECHMERENCVKKDNVTSGDWDKCRGNHYLCPSRCLDLNEPVCGSDLRIYHNICIMRKKNCGKLLRKLPLEVCYEKFGQSVDEQCPMECPPLPKPACGSNGVLYYNECFLRMRTCRQGIVKVSVDSCVLIPRCPQVCLPLYDPVCGSDGNLYTNMCRMMQVNCEKEIKRMPLSFCNSENQESSTATM